MAASFGNATKAGIMDDDMATRTPPSTTRLNDFEPHSDAWSAFERAVDAVVKSGPQHRVKSYPASDEGGGIVVYETQESENGRRIVGHYLQMPDGSRTVLSQFPSENLGSSS
jgi:hypothetical protein